MLKPEQEIYLLAVRMLSAISEANIPDVGLKKSIRSFESWANKEVQKANSVNPVTNEIAIHNFNVVLNSIDKELLATPIGLLEVE